MIRSFILLLSAWLLALPALSAGPGVDALSSRIDARNQRQESRVLSRGFTSLIASPEQATPLVRWDLSVGVGYTDGQDGSKATSTPFLLKAAFNERKTFVKLTGDGLAHLKTDAGSSSGLSDVTVSIGQLLYSQGPESKSRLVGEAGYTIPSHGEVGSTKGKERVGLAYSTPFGPAWSGYVSGRLTRFDADPPVGVSRISRSGVAQGTYDLLDGTDLVFALARSYRPGAGGASQASATYEFPLPGFRSKGLLGSIGFARGLTSGAHDNSVEFDISLSF